MQFNLNSPNIKPDERFNGTIIPGKKKIACVLLQAITGGQSGLCNLFDTRALEVGSLDGAQNISGTLAQWQRLAKEWNEYHKQTDA